MCQFPSTECDLKHTKKVMLLVFFNFLIACANPSMVPVVEHSSDSESWRMPDKYQVKTGDTLYSIAWRYGKDSKQLAALNAISPPYKIYPGQTIVLLGKKESPVRDAKIVVQKASKVNSHKPVPQDKKKRKGTLQTDKKRRYPTSKEQQKVYWRWPVDGVVISSFSSVGIGNKGLDISAKSGEAVRAAATGQVVYSGSHLVGYGKLIIIKHNDDYLSAYAHNSKLEVGEGEQIKSGQKIAEVGATGTDREKLHFEIRYRGKPINR